MSAIFWQAILAMVVLLAVSTVIGRALSRLIPGSSRPEATFYLAPAVGLAVLVVLGSLVGRHYPMTWLPLRITVAALFAFALCVEERHLDALKHSAVVACFGLVCGSPILGGLFFHGAFAAHNDAFTYLAHSIWLQTHSFSDEIGQSDLTPLSSQILMYQVMKLRMGVSYLIGLVQACSGLLWPFAVYPAVVISGVTACFMAVGFPLSRASKRLNKRPTLIMLALPAFMLNGMTFGAIFGFAPQSFGLAFASALTFLIGYLFQWSVSQVRRQREVVKAAIPAAVLFTALNYAYSEMMPFAVLAIVLSATVAIFRHKESRGTIILLALVFSVLAVFLLNTEILRTIQAIQIQRNVVVGSPVDWSAIGFLGHAFGVHGGAWDDFTWSVSGFPKDHMYFIGLGLTIAIIGLIGFASKEIGNQIIGYLLLPNLIMLLLLVGWFIYFRYGASSPFPVGMGQSWSQFKLSEWASPFISVLILIAAARVRIYAPRCFDCIALSGLVAVFAYEALIVPATLAGTTGEFTRYYGAPRSVGEYFVQLRKLTLATCSAQKAIYLDLGGTNLKARQMLTMYLNDRPLHSDWHEDPYFVIFDSHGGKDINIAGPDECVIASRDNPRYLGTGVVSGPFRIVP